MNNDPIEISTTNQVGLPLDQKTFSEVILNFLGRKENLSYKSRNNFILRIEDISQFNHLIKSKISYQKNIVLEHFSVNFEYSDKTSRQINGSDALDSFLETRSVDTTSVNLNWKIIIKFDDSPSIETQEIDLLFMTDIGIKGLKDEYSFIKLSINHTNQSWALDILNAFKDKINELSFDPPKIKKIYDKMSDSSLFLTSMVVLMLIFSVCLMFPVSSDLSQDLKKDLVRYTLKQNYNNDISKVIGLLEVTALDKKELRELKQKNKELEPIFKNSNEELMIHIFLMTLLLSAPFIINWYINYSIKYLNHKSFIVINNANNNSLQKYKDDKSKITYFGFTIVVTTIIVSIIAAIIFKIIEKLIF